MSSIRRISKVLGLVAAFVAAGGFAEASPSRPDCPPKGSLAAASERVAAAFDERDEAAYAAAVGELRRAAERAPACGEPARRLAEALFSGTVRFAKDPETAESMRAEARSALGRTHALAPGDPEVLGGLATYAANDEDRFRWSEKLAQAAPADPEVHRWLALALLQRGEVDRAVAEYRLHLKFAPYLGRESGFGHVDFAAELLRTGRIDEAARIVEKTLEVAVDESRFERCLLVQRFASGPLATTQNLGNTIRELLPYCTNLEHRNRAAALENAGKIDEAIAEYRAQLEANPAYEETYGALERLYLRQKKWMEAASALKAFLEREPEAEKRCAAAMLADARYGPKGVSIFAPMKQGCVDRAKPSPPAPPRRPGAVP